MAPGRIVMTQKMSHSGHPSLLPLNRRGYVQMVEFDDLSDAILLACRHLFTNGCVFRMSGTSVSWLAMLHHGFKPAGVCSLCFLR